MEAKLKRPPLVQTYETPHSIVGHNNMEVFKRFLRQTLSPTLDGEALEKRLNKDFGPEWRAGAAKTLEELRKNGFYPLGVSDDGRIRWGVALKSKVQETFEQGLPRLEKMSLAELQSEARNGYRGIITSVSVEQAKDWEKSFAMEAA